MDVIDVIRDRRSIRKYTDQPVSDELLEKIIEAGLWAPSNKNRQPWHFVVLRSPEAIERYQEIVHKTRQQFREELEERFPNRTFVVEESLSFMETLGGAKTVVLAFLDKEYGEDDQFASAQSTSAAVTNMTLAAWSLGIASCWMYNPKKVEGEIRAEFAPEAGTFVCALSLGYAAQQGRAPKRREGRVTYR